MVFILVFSFVLPGNVPSIAGQLHGLDTVTVSMLAVLFLNVKKARGLGVDVVVTGGRGIDTTTTTAELVLPEKLIYFG